MKKRLLLFAAALAVTALLAAAWRTLQGARLRVLEPVDFTGERGVMRIDAEAGEDLRRVTGTQVYRACNPAGRALDELVLRLYPNGIREGSLTLSSVTVDGREAAFSQDADDPTVLRVQADWAQGQTRVFAWHFALTVPAGEAFAGRTDGFALCAGALAAPALWDGEDWRTDAYDPLAAPLGTQKFDYALTLRAPDTVTAAFGGALVGRTAADGQITWTAQGVAAVDMPFALRLGGALRQREADGVLLTALAESGAQANRLLDQAARALEAIGGLGLPFPGRALCVVQAQTGLQDGLATSGLLAAAPDGNRESALRRMTRLAARQLFGIAAHNDPLREPWLSASLAASVEMLAYRRRAGENAYERRYDEEIEIAGRLTRPQGVTVGAWADRFGSDAEMTQVLRDQGAGMLLGIERAVGEEAYLRALSLYVERAGDGLAGRALLEQALFEATGSRWDGYLEDELSW